MNLERICVSYFPLNGKSVYLQYAYAAFLMGKMPMRDNMGHDARKPVFGVSDKLRFKPACSATETS